MGTRGRKQNTWALTNEHRAKIPEWNRRWINDVIRKTGQMTAANKVACEAAVRGMYRAANLDGNAVRVVFVSSPLQAAVVAGAAAAWWHTKRGGRPTASATRIATDTATATATDTATATATDTATYIATRIATDTATRIATDTATDTACESLFAIHLRAAMSVVGDCTLVRQCIARSWNMRNGGNHWASWVCFLSFVRDVVGWTHPSHDNYANYETLALLSGPRYMHEHFCIISDMPTVLAGYERDGVIVAHCDDGPSHAWADGWKLWHVDGVAVDEQIVMRPETQTIEQIEAEPNEEVRRVRIDRFGWVRYIAETGATVVDGRRNDIDGTMEMLTKTRIGARLVCSCRSTGRVYAIGIPNEVLTCEQAQQWINGAGRFAPKNIIGAS